MLSAVMAYSSWLGSVHLSSSLKVLRQTTTGLTYLTVSEVGEQTTARAAVRVLSPGTIVSFCHLDPPRDMLPWVP